MENSLCDGPDIYVLLNGVPVQAGTTCSCLAEQTIVVKAVHAQWRMVSKQYHHDRLILDKL